MSHSRRFAVALAAVFQAACGSPEQTTVAPACDAGSHFELHAGSSVVGYWSRDGMRRLLENLLSNAAKYGAPDTPIKVTVEDHEGKMRLTVNNRGAPLSSTEQARILHPYERGENARRGGKSGWGIGLTLVRGITDAHGGSLRVVSSEDEGTTFIVENPMDSRPFLEAPAGS